MHYARAYHFAVGRAALIDLGKERSVVGEDVESAIVFDKFCAVEQIGLAVIAFEGYLIAHLALSCVGIFRKQIELAGSDRELPAERRIVNVAFDARFVSGRIEEAIHIVYLHVRMKTDRLPALLAYLLGIFIREIP